MAIVCALGLSQQISDGWVYDYCWAYPLAATISDWQPGSRIDDNNPCSRIRFVTDNGCDYYEYTACASPQWVDDWETGDYVAGTGCTNWKMASETGVSTWGDSNCKM